jgi:hypothetical protein
MVDMASFFSEAYETPQWLKKKLSRRSALKSAAGATMITTMPALSWSTATKNSFTTLSQTDPWLTLDAVLDHLLPASPTGPSAKEVNASQYLFNVVYQQPTEQAEIDFIYKGVGWLNGFSTSQLQRNFIALTFEEKESTLRAISNSVAGENWLSNLVSYLFEAMLSPPSYGGNPEGIGWQWLDHQAGFPLPKVGERYFELPGKQLIAITNHYKKSANVATSTSTATKTVSNSSRTTEPTGTRKS